MEKCKNRELRNKLFQNRRRAVSFQKQNEQTCVQIVSAANQESKKTFEYMARHEKQLQDENVRLKQELSKFINTSNDEGIEISMERKSDEQWREKVEKLEAELKKAKLELQNSNIDRRNLLHNLLELKGKVRIVCRLRPILDGFSEKIDYKINQYRKLIGNTSTLAHIKSILANFFVLF